MMQKPGCYLYDPNLSKSERKARPICEYSARMSCDCKHWLVKRAMEMVPEIHGVGVRFNERSGEWILTRRAYDRLCAQHSVCENWDSMQ